MTDSSPKNKTVAPTIQMVGVRASLRSGGSDCGNGLFPRDAFLGTQRAPAENAPEPGARLAPAPDGAAGYLIPVSTETTISVKAPGSTVAVWGFANGGEVSDTI